MKREGPHPLKAERAQHVRWAVHASRTGQASQRPKIPPPNPQPSSPPHVEQLHGEPPRLDPFHWLQAGHRNPEVLRYLQQENEYSKLQLRHISKLKDAIAQEIAELSWRQAVMLTAQQQYQAPIDIPQRYGGFEYRRVPVSSDSTTYFRHLRYPCRRSDNITHEIQPQQHKQRQEQMRTGEQEQQMQQQQQHDPQRDPAPHPEHQLQQPTGLGSRYCGSGTTNPECVLDEQQRARGSAAAAHYALHSFAPSPTFEMAAFSETTKAVPLGQRLPDRFVLHIVHAETGTPLHEPLSDVSGDLGWVTLGGGDGDGATATGGTRGYSGGRVYFTRAAQRELWCLDILLPRSPPPPSVPSSSSSSSSAAAAAAAAAGDSSQVASLVPADPLSEAPAVRVFRDPDGQPIQLVQYGKYLYGETLGNTGVPLEIRLLGLASAREVEGMNGFMCQWKSGQSVQKDWDVIGVSDGPPPLVLAPPAPDAGAPLLPRRPGRQYSVLRLDLGVAFASTATSGGSGCSNGGDGGNNSSGNDGGGSGSEVFSLESHTEWQSTGSCNEPPLLLLWLRDLDHPNGCLLLVAMMEEEYLRNSGSCDPCGRPRPLLLELLPHNPALRIIHVDVCCGGGVRCVRENIDPRGDPDGHYELTELDMDLQAVRRAVVEAADLFDGGESRQPLALQLAVSAAVAGNHDSGCGDEVHIDGCPYKRVTSSLVKVRRRRTLAVQGPRQHSLRVVAWGDDGRVTLSCSSLASPPVSVTVDLLPYTVYSCGSTDATATIAMAPADFAIRRELVESRQDVVESDSRVVTERLWATSDDGAQVPITLCRVVSETVEVSNQSTQGTTRRKGDIDSEPSVLVPAPLLLHVYGAYGKDLPLDYHPAFQPLLRRGMAVAVAHVRGGGHLGPAWYEAGRGGANKARSAEDVLAAARHLVKIGATMPEMMCLAAESAGGWAAGPALNMVGASLFRAAVLTVPTLDPLTSLLEDPSYGPYELGDPRTDAALYRAIRCWSPYDGLGQNSGVPYPALLLRVGLFDTNVPYWDPAKYMARLRSMAAKDIGGGGVGNALRVMQVKPAGHEAHENVEDEAMVCAFVLWATGVWPSSLRRVSGVVPHAGPGLGRV